MPISTTRPQKREHELQQLGIDTQTIFGMPPIEHVALAADLGCSHISVGLGPVPWKLECFPNWSLKTDARLRREFAAALSDRNITIALAEGFVIRPQVDVSNRADDLDLFAKLGARRASTVSMDPDLSRTLDQLGVLAELTEERGMQVGFEFAPPHTINSLQGALAAIVSVGKPNVKLVIDAMHFFRTGGTAAELAAVDPALIGYVQLCDAPLAPQYEDYYEEACFHRLRPGDGQLPLEALLQAIPESVPVGIETPRRSSSNTAAELRSTVAQSVAAARRLLDARVPEKHRVAAAQ